jgi:thermitase
MTFTLFFAIVALGSWIISHNIRFLQKLTGILALLSIAILIISDLTSSFNISFGLFVLAKDLLILGGVSFLLTITRNNVFAQVGLFLCCLFFLFPGKSKKDDLQSFNVDKEWELLLETSENKFSDRLKDIIEHYELEVFRFNPTNLEASDLEKVLALGIPKKHEEKARTIYSLIEQTNDVEWVEYNEKLYRILPEPGVAISGKTLQTVNDPLTKAQWSMQALSMDDYYGYIRNNNIKPIKKAKLFILDTGIDAEHEDLNISASKKKTDDVDRRGHGTHCAGIAAASTNNGKGISSMSPGEEWLEVRGIKVFTELGITTQKRVIQGIIRAVDEGADVINMSLGARAYQSKEQAYNEAINYAAARGTIIIAAAGNSSDDAANYVPAKLDQVITVSSINNKLDLSFFSNYITNVTYGVAAPGHDIMSTIPGGKYEIKSGTSMAAPHVAGLVSVMKALQPSLTIEETYNILSITGMRSLQFQKSGPIINPPAVLEIMISTVN